MATLTHLPGPKGKDNQPGLKGLVYIAPEDWFEKIAGFKTTTGAGDSVTIDGSHTFKDNPATPGVKYGFLKAYATQDTAQLKLDPTGERDGRGYKASLEFFNPGAGKEAAEFMRIVKNTSCIMLVKTPDGVVQQVGAEDLGAEIVGSYDTGKLSGGRRGTTFKAEAYQQGNQFYEGTIDLLPE
jgi:hypothetical protein